MSKLITHLRVQISSTWKDKNKAPLIKLQRKALNEGMEVKKKKRKKLEDVRHITASAAQSGAAA